MKSWKSWISLNLTAMIGFYLLAISLSWISSQSHHLHQYEGWPWISKKARAIKPTHLLIQASKATFSSSDAPTASSMNVLNQPGHIDYWPSLLELTWVVNLPGRIKMIEKFELALRWRRPQSFLNFPPAKGQGLIPAYQRGVPSDIF